eukprot:COSAG03_NODE_3961_length_1740_cov_66.195612_3_plen_81_part_00
MAGASENDPEGALLSAVRGIFGPSVPLVASLDLHCVLTDMMVEHADILVPFHTYPHVDQCAELRTRLPLCSCHSPRSHLR